jgi:hypothetical protein
VKGETLWNFRSRLIPVRKRIELDQAQVLNVLAPSDIPHPSDQASLIRDAIHHPVHSAPLSEIIHACDTVAIVTSDITRPMPSYTVLPVLLQELEQIGVKKENITIVIASRFSPQTDRRRDAASCLPEEVYEEYKVINSGEEGFLHVGVTSRGTSVDIDRTVCQKRTGASVSATWNIITLPATAAVPRQSCRAVPQRKPSSRTTASWSRKMHMPAGLKAIQSAKISKKPRQKSALTLSSMLS